VEGEVRRAHQLRSAALGHRATGVALIEFGKPVQNAFVESFNSKLRVVRRKACFSSSAAFLTLLSRTDGSQPERCS